MMIFMIIIYSLVCTNKKQTVVTIVIIDHNEKSNFRDTRVITPKRVTSGGAAPKKRRSGDEPLPTLRLI